MAQLNWTYFSLLGFPYSIDMYHGEDSGHLILFVNNEIILINFNQTENKSYNFIIDRQILELKIEKKSPGFDYVLTPLKPEYNIEPEKTFDKHFWIPLFVIILFNLSVYLIFFNN